jgi:hypothetical protein
MPHSAIWVFVVIILLFAVLPVFPYNRSWGYGPSGGIGAILLILILLAIFGII